MEKQITVNELRMILSRYLYGESRKSSDVYVEAVITGGARIKVGIGQTCTLILDVREWR